MEWQGDPDRSSSPIDWRLKALLIGVPLVMVVALLYQYSKIRPVDHSPPETWPHPSPEMQRAVAADVETDQGRAELDRIMRGDEHVAAGYAAAKLAQQGEAGWIIVARVFPTLDESLQAELINGKYVKTYAIINGAGAILGADDAARIGTYAVLERTPTEPATFPFRRGTFEALSQALMDRYRVADDAERKRIAPLFNSYFSFQRETLLEFLDDENADFRYYALLGLRYAGRPGDVALIRKRLKDPDARVRSQVAETERVITIRGEDPYELQFVDASGQPTPHNRPPLPVKR